MKRENLLIACVLLAAVVLAGCGPLAPVGRNVAGTAATTPVTATPVTVSMSLLDEPSTLDPGLAYDAVSIAVINPLFLGLTELDPETQEPLPALATEWAVSEDSKTWTFTLRQDVPWVRYDQAAGKVADVVEQGGQVFVEYLDDQGVAFVVSHGCSEGPGARFQGPGEERSSLAAGTWPLEPNSICPASPRECSHAGS